MFSTTIYQKIYKEIKKYDTIVIARHTGADPDALASSIALRDIILNTFPKKKVYTVGFPVSKFKYLGILDKFHEDLYENSLLIVTDTPDLKRVDGVVPSKFKDSIKIDHHPFVDKFCNLEWIDTASSSASQMIIELVFHTKLKMTKEAAEKLYVGIVSDTNRFLFSYTSSKTFDLVSKLIQTTQIEFTNLYEPLYLKSIKESKFEGYVAEHFTITENGLAYLVCTPEMLEKYEVDASTARNMVSEFNYIDEILVWMILTNEKSGEALKGSIRSRGPIINEIAGHFNGGGHSFASGVRVENEEQFKELLTELDEGCKQYKNEQE